VRGQWATVEAPHGDMVIVVVGLGWNLCAYCCLSHYLDFKNNVCFLNGFKN
jgi:hypothetical protein